MPSVLAPSPVAVKLGEGSVHALVTMLLWRSDGRCYEEYTQGPCQLGDIVLMDRDTGVGFCGCNTTLPMYFHAETNQAQQYLLELYRCDV